MYGFIISELFQRPYACKRKLKSLLYLRVTADICDNTRLCVIKYIALPSVECTHLFTLFPPLHIFLPDNRDEVIENIQSAPVNNVWLGDNLSCVYTCASTYVHVHMCMYICGCECVCERGGNNALGIARVNI